MVNRKIFIVILCFFKPFGLVPYCTIPKVSGQFVLQKFNVLIIMGLLTVYWIAVIKSFFIESTNTDMISKVSNWMQLVINSITITVILLRPILGAKTFKRILSKCEMIDQKLSEFPIKMKNKQLLACIAIAIGSFAFYLIFLVSFDYYVSLIKYRVYTRIYWFITNFPMIIYSAGIWYAFCLFINVYFRIKFGNKLLKHEIKYRFV